MIDRMTERQTDDRYNNRQTEAMTERQRERQTDRETDSCRSVERERQCWRSLGAGLCVCMPQAGLFWGGIRPPDLRPGWITSHCLPLLLFMEQQRLKLFLSNTPLTHLHLICCANYPAIHVEKHEFIWLTELMSSMLLISNITVTALKTTVIDVLCIHIFRFPLALTSPVQPDKFQHFRARKC